MKLLDKKLFKYILTSSLLLTTISGCSSQPEGIPGQAKEVLTETSQTFSDYALLDFVKENERIYKHGDVVYTPGITHTVKDS